VTPRWKKPAAPKGSLDLERENALKRSLDPERENPPKGRLDPERLRMPRRVDGLNGGPDATTNAAHSPTGVVPLQDAAKPHSRFRWAIHVVTDERLPAAAA
jgi:hypothetical protein